MNHEEAIEQPLFGGKLGMDLGPVIANTCPFNYTGHPAISIPCGKSEGLPIGLMLVAPHLREDVLFRAAHTYQQSVDWAALISTPARGGSKALRYGSRGRGGAPTCGTYAFPHSTTTART